jgi:hypothetical protein
MVLRSRMKCELAVVEYREEVVEKVAIEILV